MSSVAIQVSDPLALLPALNGRVDPPLQESGASSGQSLDSKQRAAVIGDVVPIVFCRRVGSTGGVLVSPAATEARFENDATNQLEVKYHLVISEGQIDQLQIRDVFQRSCRVGTWQQTYNRRAGSFTAGNFVTAQPGYTPPECPNYCGTSGTYAGMSTALFANTYPDGDDRWDRQVHCFVRGGLRVTRLLDSVTGPSNNIADLAQYLLTNCTRLPAEKIDSAALLIAAKFTDANGFYFNGIMDQSTNLEDWLYDIAPHYLLAVSDDKGKKGLRPLLPINTDGTIKTTALTPAFTFTEDHIAGPGDFQISYIPLSERKAICALMLWRQQSDDDFGIVRTAEVRVSGTAANGPYEQHDLSAFCATENHAVKVGAYKTARRRYITHTLRLKVRHGSYANTLAPGSIVRVTLARRTAVAAAGSHDYMYEIDRIGRSVTSGITLDLTHLPVDSTGRSLVALAVNSAVGAGYMLATAKTGLTCDVNSSTDTTTLADVGGNLATLPADSNFQYSGTALSEAAPSVSNTNPAETLDGQNSGTTASTSLTGTAAVGSALSVAQICDGGMVRWYKRDKDTGVRTLLSESDPEGWTQGSSLQLTTSELGYWIDAELYCPGETPTTTTISSSTIVAGLTCPGNSYTFTISYNLQGKSFLGTCTGGTKNGAVLSGSTAVVKLYANIDNVYWHTELATNDCDGSHAGKVREYWLVNGSPSQIIWSSGSSNGYSSDYWEGGPPTYTVACTNP